MTRSELLTHLGASLSTWPKPYHDLNRYRFKGWEVVSDGKTVHFKHNDETITGEDWYFERLKHVR